MHQLSFCPKLCVWECQRIFCRRQVQPSFIPVLIFYYMFLIVYFGWSILSGPYTCQEIFNSMSKMSVSFCHRFLQTQVWKFFCKKPCEIFNKFFSYWRPGNLFFFLQCRDMSFPSSRYLNRFHLPVSMLLGQQLWMLYNSRQVTVSAAIFMENCTFCSCGTGQAIFVSLHFFITESGPFFDADSSHVPDISKGCSDYSLEYKKWYLMLCQEDVNLWWETSWFMEAMSPFLYSVLWFQSV